MSQYKKVSSCCGSSIQKENKCDCPCQLIVEDAVIMYMLQQGQTAQFYDGRAVDLHGEVCINLVGNVVQGGELDVNFTTNGIVQTVTLDTVSFNKLFSFENVTKVEATCKVQGPDDMCMGELIIDGMTVPCKTH
ncbi:hypothetical protein [Cytobacillus sp. IB215665]|uniref:hypothetical protein n=1 Tax=Cytobacillus sp. IB215665 TaxID=3097357 RepID=UPI002A0CBD8E|nr:hypothetical protein [Cytobacillus sp. IB215665]MDX8366116.1 hypothetical protein [Cytobacillus sp. IB215665]